MTSAFDRLQNEPQTGVTLGAFSLPERQLVRRVTITSNGEPTTNGGGRFTPVYYLEGDERAAAEVFVEHNRALLEDIDFSKRNVVEASVARELYDWILHYCGERTLETYETVVRENRPNGTTWVIDREKYEAHPVRRYTTNPGRARVPAAVDLAAIYAETPATITETALADTAIAGDVRQVLDYYRVCDAYACRPATVDDELAVVKQAAAVANDADTRRVED